MSGRPASLPGNRKLQSVPAKSVPNESASEGADSKNPQLHTSFLTRRSLLRILGGTATAGMFLKCMGHISNFDGCLQFFREFPVIDKVLAQRLFPDEEQLNRFARFEQIDANDQRLLGKLFGAWNESSISLVPAASHAFLKPHGEYGGGYGWYPIDGECSADYAKRFTGEIHFQHFDQSPEIRRADTVVAFGSQVSNAITRKYLGEPHVEKPSFRVNGNGWYANLEWNLHVIGEGPDQKKLAYLREMAIRAADYGVHAGTVGTQDHRQVVDQFLDYETSGQQHRFVGITGEVYEPNIKNGKLTDDYLLITSLPRFQPGAKQRVVIFGGAHGPGQKATSALLRCPPIKLLAEVEEYIHGKRFYQALFRVKLMENQNGELCPDEINLVGAVDLKIG